MNGENKMAYSPKVSVIINTCDRCFHLKRLLDCLLYQAYENFEVIVVNGPSRDNTEQVLENYRDFIRVEKCPDNNLCLSRNIGVESSAGEILAFIDDDAVPADNYWLANGVKCFSDQNIGIVGGDSRKVGGAYEYKYGMISIFGESKISDDINLLNNCDGEWFSAPRGNNLFLRKEAIIKIGGFDLFYKYFLDESDVAIRIIQSGYKMKYAENCTVIHEAATGTFRTSPYDLDWNVIAASQAYFVSKFTEKSSFDKNKRKEFILNSGNHWLKQFNDLKKNGVIAEEECIRYSNAVKSGIDYGFSAAKNERKLKFDFKNNNQYFIKFPTISKKHNLNICLLCEDNVKQPIGGVAVYTKMLADGLSSLGHNIYVITKGESDVLENYEGINYCYTKTIPCPVKSLPNMSGSKNKLDFAYSCFLKLQELKSCFHIDIVESPLWDSPGFVIAELEKEVPLVVRLQTPLKMVMNTLKKENTPDLELLTELEKNMMLKADKIISISNCIKETIQELYNITFNNCTNNYLGINTDKKAECNRAEDDGKLIVFFVGRLERRKGIDVILSAIPQLMKKFPNLEIHLGGDYNIFDNVIQGSYKRKFENMYSSEDWYKNVKFLGKISEQEKEQEYANCDVFVSPSLYESFGIIFIEAMRYSKPVIGCNIGGMKEVVDNNVTGFLCEPGDAQGFEKYMEKLLSDKKLREKFGNAGYIRLNKMFSDKATCLGTEAIYKEVIKNSSF